MATVDPIFAVLSAAVYENGRREANLIVNLPDGVTPVTGRANGAGHAKREY